MADHVHPDLTLNPHARGHQEDRIDVRAIGLFAVGLLTVLSIVFGVLAMMMNRFGEERQKLEELRPALFTLDDPELYPGPRLQESPGRDMAKMRSEVDRRLRSYGWVDKEKGVAHIPIDRAMEIVAERGLPTRLSSPGSESE